MKIGISSIRTPDMRINRLELITKLQELGHSVVYIGRESEKDIHQDYGIYNVPFLTMPLGRSNTNPIKEVRAILEIKRILKENDIDVLIVYGIRTFPTMVIAAKLATVKKVLCIVNGSGRLFQLKGIKGLFVKCISYPMIFASFLSSNGVLFQNSDDLKLIRKKGLLWRRNYRTVNGSGVNLEEYPFEKIENKPVFLMISRLTGSKGVNEYVQAAAYVKLLYPDSSFHLVGPLDDDDSSINMNALRSNIENGTIYMEGEVDDVRPYIKKCRIFVLPSYYPEGIPRSILEAMSMGRPIITTDSTGCRETVEDGVNGFLVQPKNSTELREKMIWMIKNPQQTENMGQESRRIAEERFDIHSINKIMIDTLNI